MNTSYKAKKSVISESNYNNYFDKCFQSSSHPKLFIDPDFYIVKANEAFSSIFNINESSYKDLQFFELNFNNKSDIEYRLNELKNNNNSEIDFTTSFQNKNDKKIYVNIKILGFYKNTDFMGAIIFIDQVSNFTVNENMLSAIASCMSLVDNESIFDTFVSTIASLAGIPFVGIGELHKKDNAITLKSFWANDDFLKNVIYPLENSPCIEVMETKGMVYYEKGIQEKYCTNQTLADWNIDSFLGIGLKDANNNVIGHIIFMDVKPFENIELLKSIIMLYQERIARKLEADIRERTGLKNELQLSHLFEHCPVGMVIDDEDNTIIANPKFCKMLGYTYDELRKLKSTDITHPDDLKRHIRENKKLVDKQLDVLEIEKRYVHKSGATIWANVSVAPLYSKNGTKKNTIVIVNDITERKKAAETLMHNQAFQKAIINAIPDLKFRVNKHGEFIDYYYSASATKNIMFSSPISLLGKNISEILPNEVANKALHLIKKAIDTKLVQQLEHDIKNVEGEIQYFEARINMISNNEVLIVVRNISEAKIAQQNIKNTVQELDTKNKQLQKYIDSNLQLENFAHIASHDLKEPLRTIGNFSQILAKRLGNDLDGANKEYLEFILSGVKNMNRLVDDLLTYSSVNNNKDQVEEVDLNDTTYLVLNIMDGSINENNAVVHFDNLPTIMANKTKMKQLFQNLISNAVKYRKKEIDPIVNISAIENEDCWEFAVSDNGIGVQEEFHDKIFQLFKKLHNKSEYEGTGIGLALCKKIVEQYNGEIWVKSEYGKGTTFYFTMCKDLVKGHL